MALSELPFRPGVIKDETNYGARGYAADTNLIRWVRGKPEVLGGWVQKITGIQGKPRGMWEWATSDGRPYCAIATNSNLYVWDGGALIDITPTSGAATLGSAPFATTSGSATVTVTHASHGAIVGDTVYLGGAAAVGGLQIGPAPVTGLTNPFTATAGSTIIKVVAANHGLSDNWEVEFPSVGASFGGFTATEMQNGRFRVKVLNTGVFQIEGPHAATTTATGGGTVNMTGAAPFLISAVPSSSTYQITAGSNAASTTTGGGSGVRAAYNVNIGREGFVPSSTGFGLGAFGRGAFGKGARGVVDNTPLPARLWSLCNFGNTLIACIVGGVSIGGTTTSMFAWPGENGERNRATKISNAPAKVLAVASTSERILLACGCTNGAGDFDPLLVRNTDIEDFTSWTPTATNSAGDLRLGNGAKVVGTVSRESGTMIFTDNALYALRFVGDADQIYQAVQAGVDCGLLSINAAAQRDNDLYWISPSYQFWLYQGGKPVSLECPIREWFEVRLNKAQADKIFAYADTRFQAVSWTYPTSSSLEPNEYIRLDVPETRSDAMAGWSNGVLDRTAYSPGRVFTSKKPLGVSPSGVLYEHENGWTGNGVTRQCFVDWAPLEVGDGNTRARISRLVIDMDIQENAFVILTAKEYPKAIGRTRVLTVQPTTQRSDTRITGRQIGMKLIFPGLTYGRLSSARGDLSEDSKR